MPDDFLIHIITPYKTNCIFCLFILESMVCKDYLCRKTTEKEIKERLKEFIEDWMK